MNYTMEQFAVNYVLLKTLSSEHYRFFTETDEEKQVLIAKKEQIEYRIHSIGHAQSKKIRAQEFNEGLERTISNHREGIIASVLALPIEYEQGMLQRLEAHKTRFSWKDVRNNKADTQIWYISQPNSRIMQPIKKLSLKQWLDFQPPMPNEKVCANCRYSRHMLWIGEVCSNLKNQDEEWAANRKIMNDIIRVNLRFSCENFERK